MSTDTGLKLRIYHIYQTISRNAGRLNANVAPFPSRLLSAHILPPLLRDI